MVVPAFPGIWENGWIFGGKQPGVTMEQKQRERFELLRRKCESEGLDMVKQLEQVLHMAKSTVYRRLEGLTLLDLREITLIQEHFQLPSDFFTGAAAPYVNFHFPTLLRQPDSVEAYLGPIRENLRLLRNQDSPHVYYSTSEIPFFHYFHIPELAYFKFFLWAGTVWQMPAMKGKKFDRDLIVEFDRQGLAEQLRDMLAIYQSIPSSEFWSVNVLDNTMNQIRFQYEARQLPDRDLALTLMDHLLQLIRLMERQATDGFKMGTNTPYELLHNEITHTNNTILITADRQPVGVFMTYDNPNFMLCRDPRLLNYTREWFAKLENGSILITRTGTRQRSRFFKELESRWEQARNRLA
jgi:hypothetical protein